MITGELKSQVDKVWGAFWTGGISNPISAIEQLTYLLFIKRHLTNNMMMEFGVCSVMKVMFPRLSKIISRVNANAIA